MAVGSRALRGEDWAQHLRERLETAPADTISWMEQHTRPLKSDTHSRVGLLELRDQPCYLKLYLARSWLQKLGFQLGYGRGLRSFDMAAELARSGLLVPRARACLLVPEGMMLLTEGIPGSRDLRALWRDQPAPELASLLMQNAAYTLAGLHDAGFAHGDCKWSNLLWRENKFYLVDLEAVRRVKFAGLARLETHPRQCRDLARFTVDAEELAAGSDLYEMFLASYCAALGCDRNRLVSRVQPELEMLRSRHREKYDTSPGTLL